MKITGGGTYDKDNKPLYFAAIDNNMGNRLIKQRLLESVLMAYPVINEKHIDKAIIWAEQGVRLLIDSGVYSYVQKHIRSNNLSQTKGFNLKPAEIPKFDEMLLGYVNFIKKIEPYVWGYIELDFGGEEAKRNTRKILEDNGISPIPVYHPFNDSYEYFDELAEQYNRICVGNIVYMETYQRTRILHTIDERKKRYPELWVHLLGYTPDDLLYSTTIESADSTGWLSGVKYGNAYASGGGYTFGKLSKGYVYNKQEKDSHKKQFALLAYLAIMKEKEWKTSTEDMLQASMATI